ncbi:MAG: hypothetical protein PHU70_02680 [Dehalococcoidia bacterium]|nr:hypothetical protein [Dehalococcoidia bacterium]MDD5647474.1 hypothetical protein [Dehalococcoidia bacterium]
MNRTWKPVTAGILDIIAGAAGLILGFGFMIGGAIVGFITQMPMWLNTLIPVISIPLIILGLIDISGGICALVRKVWGLALAGSITTLITSPVIGIIALVLTAISKKEFS